MVLMTHGSPIVRAAFPLEIVTRWLSFPPWRYAMYVCVYHETSALGRKLFSWFPCFVFRIFLKTTGFFRFPHNPELSLFGSLSTVIFFFFFSIKYLTWARKVRVPVCADALKFLSHVSVVVIARIVHIISDNLVLKTTISRNSHL